LNAEMVWDDNVGLKGGKLIFL